ncbi:DUF1722 domain-containing protein [Permianibacter sp. IMCC34836]|uniref:YbgA family protein n=1 Tax=Permianibacter fluminis TaxID=2738515 RepID=UPI00155716BA|nr:DUF523 and DUF1722 domain-containing protein [Permianibacter fluminis]NQD37124.1 DUF1722 domain-containing protein [Permianibacter fluminis]
MIPFETPAQKPVVGISTCLLGEPVRYDGAHKRDDYLTGVLSTHFDYRPYCPEVGIGLGVPRPPIQLINIDGAIRVRGVREPERDFTDALHQFADRQLPSQRTLSGYVLKSKSPSCGMERVKVHGAKGGLPQHSSGAYAARLLQNLPLLPVEEEGRLHDPVLRENFIVRVYAYARWQALRASHPSKADIIAFHTRHKLLLLAHNEAAYRRLGRMVAELKGPLSAHWLDAYANEFMAALKRKASRKRHTNVLQHIAGYFKRTLDAADRDELATLIDDYRLEKVPLIVPLTLLQHHLRKQPDAYLNQQLYFAPYPTELGLRNVL